MFDNTTKILCSAVNAAILRQEHYAYNVATNKAASTTKNSSPFSVSLSKNNPQSTLEQTLFNASENLMSFQTLSKGINEKIHHLNLVFEGSKSL